MHVYILLLHLLLCYFSSLPFLVNKDKYNVVYVRVLRWFSDNFSVHDKDSLSYHIVSSRLG